MSVPAEIIDLTMIALSSRWLPSPDPNITSVRNLDKLQGLFPETDVYQPVVFNEPTYEDDFGLYLRPIKGFSEEEVTVFNSDKVGYDCFNCNKIVIASPILEASYGHIRASCRECRAPISRKA
ncbi:hypothetical protein J4447_03425 [Candidatus Pacearchaeota archaeon]|nr:hypothetical protein [Candidatus Pacearchaeota archaeon]